MNTTYISYVTPGLTALALLVSALPGAPVAKAQTTWYVDDDAPNDPGPGTPLIGDPLEDGSATHPFDAIQEGIAAASGGDLVLVLDGTYTGLGNRDIDFLGKAITVRSQNGPAACTIDCQASESDRHRGFWFHNSEGQASVVEGLTIKNGYGADESIGSVLSVGGAIFCNSADPTITNCVITQNTAGSTSNTVASRGGGIYLHNSDASVADSVMTYNTLLGYVGDLPGHPLYPPGGGGGIACFGGSPTITNCLVARNVIGTPTGNFPISIPMGGGINCYYTSAVIRGCTITGNHARGPDPFDLGVGGGLAWNGPAPSGTIADCTINGNNGEGRAGGLAFGHAASVVVSNCRIAGNRSLAGGGIWIDSGSQTAIFNSVIVGNISATETGGIRYNLSVDVTHMMANCVVSGNDAVEDGGGLYISGSYTIVAVIMANCIIADNRSNYYGGLYAGSTNVRLTNCIFWGDIPDEITGDSCDISFCDVQGGASGSINSDPGFLGGSSGTWSQGGVYDPVSYQITLSDSGANWANDALVGSFVNPDTTQPLQFVIVANTATTVTALADWQTIDSGSCWVTSGMSYQIHDYHLTAGSPCIDFADDTAVPADAADLDGDGDTGERLPFDLDKTPRFVDDPLSADLGVADPPNYPVIADMGPFEYKLLGDMDCNDVVNMNDVPAFALALLDPIGYATAYPQCDIERADMNRDSFVDGKDVQRFVEAVMP